MEKEIFTVPESGVSLGDIAALMNNNGGNSQMWNNPMWTLIFLAFLGNGGFGFGNNKGTNANTDFVSSQLGQAIAGNANAISNLATQLNCTEGQIQSSIQNLLSAVSNVANTNNMNSQSIINSINSGNQTLLSQLQSCCCDMKTIVTNQGYENRLANAEQTTTLTNAINAQTTFLSDKFCDLEKRELTNKLDYLRETNSTLQNQISNLNQTNQFAQMIASAINPINTAIAGLTNTVNEIKCTTPSTVTVPANNGVLVPPCAAAQLGLYGNPYNQSIWG